MSTDSLTTTYTYTAALLDGLAAGGVRHLCLCPGSRSTPLALAAVQRHDITLWMHVDERSAAFFALGLARGTDTPVALLCTSGTAAANFYPAVVEAHYGRVPLVVLTADRPPELRENGAAQAIDQLRLYGTHAKWFVEMAPPDSNAALARYAAATGRRAALLACAGPAGAVHLNLPLREPFVPLPPLPASIEVGVSAAPHPSLLSEPQVPRMAAPETVALLTRLLVSTPRGAIVCGPQPDPALAPVLVQLATLLRYPVLADPLSGLRTGRHEQTQLCTAYDAYLRDEAVATALQPDLVLRLGAVPTSKPLNTALQGVYTILIDGDGEWRDPTARVAEVVWADPTTLCTALVAEIERQSCVHDLHWLPRWKAAEGAARQTITDYLAAVDEPFEGKVFSELATLLPDGVTLFVGNSMPVRDLDTFFTGSRHAVRLLANRGANGIDGVVSTALGVAAAGGRVVLAIGDLSFYHDMNGLLAARRHALDVTIVLLNNDGGGIFSFLPQASEAAHFEYLFGTPTGLDFKHAADLYGLPYRRVDDWLTFRSALSASLQRAGVEVIELRTARDRNVEQHRALWPRVREAVWATLQ